jgi:hypothetical protein
MNCGRSTAPSAITSKLPSGNPKAASVGGHFRFQT